MRAADHLTMSAATHRTPDSGATGQVQPVVVTPGVMSPPLPAQRGPGLMAMQSRSARGFMAPDPSMRAFDWSRDGVAGLWLIVAILAFVLWIVLLGHGVGQR
jgi:hypothetical protein